MEHGTIETTDEHEPIPRAHWVRVLLVLPFIAMLWVRSYNAAEPSLIGLPFFYWYQLAWVLITVVIIGLIYLVEKGSRP